jgi:hypothetical protein
MLFSKRILDCVVKCRSAKNWTRSPKNIRDLRLIFGRMNYGGINSEF